METCHNNPTRDPLLLLKERIIKAEVLLNKYACLSKKCSDLEVSHSQAVENEKSAKKDAAKYVEKYCKLTKKCNCLTSKINTLEQTIKGKENELEEYQNEFAKLESVIQMYKTERKGHQSLKRDKDFLLTHLWKILKQSEKGAKDSKIRKLGEIFFKKFEKELAELKLEDFRKLQQKNNSKLPMFHETTEVMRSSPGSQLMDSDESDSMETDSLPTVKNLPALNTNYVTERVTNPCRNSSSADKQSCISNTSVEEANVLKNDPATAIERSTSEGKETVRKIKVNENHEIVKDSKGLDNSGLNSNKNGPSNGSSINLDISLPPNAMYSSSGAVGEKCGSEVVSHKNLDVGKELTSERDAKEKTRGKFNRTYLNRKFTNLSQNERFNSDASDKPNCTSHSDSQSKVEIVSEAANSFTLSDLDCSNSSSEVISLDIDDKAGDLKNLPEHGRFYEKIFNSVSGFESRSDLMDSNSENSTSLLFLMENNLTNVEPDFSAENNEETCSKSIRNFSIFDVQDSGDMAKDSEGTPEEIQDTCVEFTSDNRNMIDLNEEVEDSINEKCIDQDGVNPHGASYQEKKIITVQNDKPEDNSNLTERLPRNDTEPEDRFASDTFQNRLVNSDSNDSISDEEIIRILRSVAPVRLLSPIKEKEPNVRDELVNRRSLNQEKNSLIPEDTQLKNSTSNSNENMIISKQGNCTEEPLKTIGNVLLETKKMADKFVQTVEPSRDDKGCQKSGRIKKTILSKSVIRNICNIIWKTNLKLTYGNHSANYVKGHSSCFAILKAMFGVFKCHKLQNCTRTEEKLKNLLDKGKSRSRNRIQLLSKKSCWEVSDVEVAEANCDKIQDSFDCSTDKADEFLTHVPNFHNPNDTVVDNFMIPAEKIRVPEDKSFVWLTPRQELSFGNQEPGQPNVDEKVCEGTFSWEEKIDAEINFERDVKADSFKKENEGFLKAGTDVKCLGSGLYAKTESCGIVEENVINVEYDSLKPESKHFESCREAGKAENDHGKELEGTEKPLLRRSPRLQNRNVLVSVKNTFTDEPSVISPPETKSDSDSDRISSKISSNESGSFQNLKRKFEDLFGEAEELQFEVPKHGKEPENIPGEEPERHARESTTKTTSADSQTDNRKRAVIKRLKPGSCHIKSQKTNGIPKRKRPNLIVPEESKGESNEIDAGHETNGGTDLLDSIMNAMTKQKEEFKVKPPVRGAEITNLGVCGSNVPTVAYPMKDPKVETPVQNEIGEECEMKGNDPEFSNLSHDRGLGSNPGNQIIEENSSKVTQVPKWNLTEEKIRNLVQKEISSFVRMNIGSVEEGQEKVKSCLTVLEKAGEDTVANVIVSEVMANVDEELLEFDRPAPPLTRTQHRIMIILACLGKSSEQHNGISYKILKIIWSKLFPENFFWPDDSVEMASRFYAALCKRLNNFKGIWKFCFKAISSMRQRWCLPIFVVLQVWPDILHNAHEIQENILVNTFVNVILHSPKTEEMRRKGQEQKLLAVKHLLINFYNFDCNSTIEGFTQKLIESHLQNVPGSSDALVLLSKCRKWEWTRKNVLGKLLETLDAWSSGDVPDETGSKTLDVIYQTASVFPGPETPMAPSVEDVISTFSKILNSENLKPSSEEKVIRILCCLCHYSSVKDILGRISGKYPSDCVIYSEIKRAINSSTQKAKRRGASMKAKKITKRRNNGKKNIKKKGKRKKKKKKSSSQKKVLEMSEPSEQT